MDDNTLKGTSVTTTNTLAVIGAIALGVTVIPTVVLLISSIPDIARYIRILRM